MNQPTQQTDTSATPTNGAASTAATSTKFTGTFQERLAAATAALDAPSDSADESDESSPPAASPASAAESEGAPADTPATAAADPDAAKRAAERRARLDAAMAANREQVGRKTHLATLDKMQRELAAAQAQAAEAQARAEAAEKAAAARIDVDTIDEAALFALAEKRGIGPQKLGEWIQTAMTSPEKIAEAAALKATRASIDPEIAALKAQNAELMQTVQSFLEEQRAAKLADAAKASEEQYTTQFLSMVAQSAERAPLAAKLLAKNRAEFMQMAELAAGSVAGMGAEALLDAVEDLLDGEGRAHAQALAELYGFSPASPTPTSQTPATRPTTTRGPAKPNTVSNSLAQQRASVLEEEDFARLPFSERVARLTHD